MPRRRWVHNLAVIGCLITGGLLLCGCDQIQAAVKAAAQQNVGAPSDTTAEGKTFKPDSYREECEKPQKTQEADLCQQWRMANAAEKQLKLIQDQVEIQERQIVLQRWEIGLLSGTFGFSLFALWTTVKTSRAELRAYVYVKKTVWDQTHGDNVADQLTILTVKNGGKTPARDVRVRIDRAAGPREWRTQKGDLVSVNPQETTFHLPAGEINELTVPMRALATNMLSFTARSHDFFIWGDITYKDTFNREWKTGFRVVVSNDGIASYAGCQEGNYTT